MIMILLIVNVSNSKFVMILLMINISNSKLEIAFP